jgi:hypothetical protein
VTVVGSHVDAISKYFAFVVHGRRNDFQGSDKAVMMTRMEKKRKLCANDESVRRGGEVKSNDVALKEAKCDVACASVIGLATVAHLQVPC